MNTAAQRAAEADPEYIAAHRETEVAFHSKEIALARWKCAIAAETAIWERIKAKVQQ